MIDFFSDTTIKLDSFNTESSENDDINFVPPVFDVYSRFLDTRPIAQTSAITEDSICTAGNPPQTAQRFPLSPVPVAPAISREVVYTPDPSEFDPRHFHLHHQLDL